MVAWLGLTPRQMTTGGRPRLLGISKRGNRYLRKNLIHGARAMLPYHLAGGSLRSGGRVATQEGGEATIIIVARFSI
jgi:transposase